MKTKEYLRIYFHCLGFASELDSDAISDGLNLKKVQRVGSDPYGASQIV